MASDNNRKGSSSFTIILGIIILVLFSMYINQVQTNRQADQVFAQQTAYAEYQRSISLTATKQIENKVQGCRDIFHLTNGIVFNPFNPTCVVGVVYTVQELKKNDPNEPQSYATYFDTDPTTFFLFGPYDTHRYVGKCVKVLGEIKYTTKNIPAMYVNEYIDNIEELPDNVCR